MAAWLKEDNQDILAKTILFLISPFFAFLYSLRRIKTKSSYVIFFLFSVFFGMSFTVGNFREEGSNDGISYRIKFESYQYVSSYQYFDGLKEFFTFDAGSKDYYFDTIAFYVSRITDNYHVMFMVFAIIFVFISLKTFKIFTTEDNFKTSFACLILAYLFMINQIFNINGMRFWTAAWIGVYSIFQIFKYQNKKYFLLALCTPFFHGSFWVFIGVIILAYFFKKYNRLWVILFFISFFISELSITLVQNFIDIMPAFLQRMASYYTEADYIETRSQTGTGFWWVSILFSILVRIYFNAIVFLFIKNTKLINSNLKTKSLYQFLLVWMTIFNFTMAVPSLGGRFITLAYPIIAYIWLINFEGDIKRYRNFLYLMPLVYFMHFYYLIFLNYGNSLESCFFYSSPFYLIYKYLLIA